MRNRELNIKLLQEKDSRFSRIIVLTGARQTGKTTLIKKVYPQYEYISFDDPVTRPDFLALSAQEWHVRYPCAILDEVQKAPSVIESIKAVYDQYDDSRHVLSGSSQILLLQQIRETLAGRCRLMELFPLTLPEMRTQSWNDELNESVLVKLLRHGFTREDLPLSPASERSFAEASTNFERYLLVGGYPVLWNEDVSNHDAAEWLYGYIQTYLQRDIRDLAEIRNLEPFVMAQRVSADLTGTLVNYSILAKESGVSVKTAQRFLQYLQMSYQVILLQPWFRNRLKRFSKTPKLHYLDPGIQSTVCGRSGTPTGFEFESAVIAEIYKQIKNAGLRVNLYHLRTADGKEVDLLVETADKYYAFEIKKSRNIQKSDGRHLLRLADLLDKPLAHSFVVSNDNSVKHLYDDITALPAALLLG